MSTYRAQRARVFKDATSSVVARDAGERTTWPSLTTLSFDGPPPRAPTEAQGAQARSRDGYVGVLLAVALVTAVGALLRTKPSVNLIATTASHAAQPKPAASSAPGDDARARAALQAPPVATPSAPVQRAVTATPPSEGDKTTPVATTQARVAPPASVPRRDAAEVSPSDGQDGPRCALVRGTWRLTSKVTAAPDRRFLNARGRYYLKVVPDCGFTLVKTGYYHYATNAFTRFRPDQVQTATGRFVEAGPGGLPRGSFSFLLTSSSGFDLSMAAELSFTSSNTLTVQWRYTGADWIAEGLVGVMAASRGGR